MERCGQRVVGRVGTRTFDHPGTEFQPRDERPAGREREAEVAEPAVGIEHPLPGGGGEHRHHPSHQRAIHLGIDLDEVERREREANPAVVEPIVQLPARARERPGGVRSPGLQPDPDPVRERERLDRIEVVRRERIQMANDEDRRVFPRRDLDLRNPRPRLERAHQLAQRHHQRTGGVREHLAVGDVRDPVGNPLAKSDQRPEPAGDVTRTEPGLAAIPPGRAGQWRHDLPGSDARDRSEGREQDALLVAELRVVGEMLEAAPAATRVERASRLDPLGGRIGDLLHHCFVVAPAALHAPADDLFSRQRAVNERRLAAAGAADSPALRVEVVDADRRDPRRSRRHLMLRPQPRGHDDAHARRNSARWGRASSCSAFRTASHSLSYPPGDSRPRISS